MAQFWETQRLARRWTTFYLCAFTLLTLGIAALIELTTRALYQAGYTGPMPYLSIVFVLMTFLVAGVYYLIYRSSGGAFVARSVGGREVVAETALFEERQLLNIVEEMALASGQPRPAVFILESPEINAFAAGVRPEKAAIAITRGALRLLSREELQGVIAHEFGHIYNSDMKISMRLAAMIMGFTFILYLGLRLLEGSLLFGGRERRNGGNNNNPIALAAFILLLAGALTWFGGALLRSMISRQREYLADACAVQFTRNPQGIAGALRKISEQHISAMPRSGMAYSHLYFDNHSFWSSLFATHPPIKKRIAAILGTRASEE